MALITVSPANFGGCQRTVTLDGSISGSTLNYTITSTCSSSEQAYTGIQLLLNGASIHHEYSTGSSGWGVYPIGKNCSFSGSHSVNKNSSIVLTLKVSSGSDIGGGGNKAEGSYTFTIWNDINAYRPDGSTQNGLIFNLTTSDGGSWTNLTNEPNNFYKTYGTTATISNIRPNVTGIHYTKNSVTNNNASSFTWTFNSANYIVHLYSAWNTYTVRYNANGGSGSMANTTATYNTAFNLRNNSYTRSGYSFLGWSTSSNATTATYSNGQSVSNLTTVNGGTVDLYAVWEALPPQDLLIYATDRDTNSITLTLGSISAIDITGYTIYYKVSSDTGYISINIDETTEYTITGLNADTDYDIYFVATNASGSTESEVWTYSTLLNDPMITLIEVNNLTPFACDIMVNASIDPARELQYSFSNDGGTTWTDYQGSNIYSWNDLEEETKYNIFVKVKAVHIGINSSDTFAEDNITITTPADQAKIRIKQNGQWIKGKTYYKKDGQWIKAKKIYIKVDGQWKINNNYDN